MTEETTDYKPQAASHNMAVALIESGAPNYYGERLITNATDREIEVIARYVDGETLIDQLRKANAKIHEYELALGRIAEGTPSPMLLARAVLSGAPGSVE